MKCRALRGLGDDHEEVAPGQAVSTEPVEAEAECDQVELDGGAVLLDQVEQPDYSPRPTPFMYLRT